MKKQVLYICEMCGTQFSNEKEANECENNHIKPSEIGAYGFHRDNGLNYPDCIWIRMCDGKKIMYKR